MSTDRLPSELEASALVRLIQLQGDFSTVVRKGDLESGSLLLVITSRGRHIAILERVADLQGGYSWHRCGPSESAGSADVAEFLARRARFDPDSWEIELDIADPERFIAETTCVG